MNLPFARHLEWLCLEGLSLQDVQRFYSNVQFPVPTEKDFEEACEKVRKLPLPPAVRRNLRRSKFVDTDSAVLEKFGYGDVHRQRCFRPEGSKSHLAQAWGEVGKLLSHPVMRVALDACLIAKVPEEKLSLMLPAAFSLSLSEQAIAIYRHYFWDTELFGREEWLDFLKRVREDSYVYVRYFTALTRTREEVFHLCQIPGEHQFSNFLKNTLATARYKFDYYSRQNTPDADHEARKWAKVGFESGEKYEKFGAADATDFSKLVQTEFEYVSPQIPTLDEETARQLLPQLTTPEDPKK